MGTRDVSALGGRLAIEIAAERPVLDIGLERTIGECVQRDGVPGRTAQDDCARKRAGVR